jgi:tetratricopeptide (TPR) repeat protein
MFMKKSITILTLACLLIGSKATAQINKEYFFARGTNELLEHRYAAAIGHFNVLIKVDTTLYDAYFRRAIAKYNLSDYLGALGDFNKAIRLNPVFTYAYFYRAITHNSMGDYSAALRDLEEANSLRPELPGVYYTRALSYFFMQQFGRAIEDFDRFLHYEPREPEGYVNRGTCKLFLQDTIGALTDYNRAIAINAHDPEGYSRRGRVHAMQGKNSDALRDFDMAVKLDSSSAISYYYRAIAHYNDKNIGAALSDFDRVLSLDPYNALTLYNRALMLSQTGDYDRAIDSYTQAADINPGNVLIYYNRAAVFLEKNMPRQAIDDYTKAIELYPDFANAYLNRAYAKRLRNDMRGAAKDHEVAMKKIAEHQNKLAADSSSLYAFADTSQKFNQLVAFDADFGNKNFSGDQLQYRRVDITLLPLFRLAVGVADAVRSFDRSYFSPGLEAFRRIAPQLAIAVVNGKPTRTPERMRQLLEQSEHTIDSLHSSSIGYFAKASLLEEQNQYTGSLSHYKQALNMDKGSAFYLFNLSVAQSDMVDFISSIDNNAQVIELDGNTTTTGSVKNKSAAAMTYSYDEAIGDLRQCLAQQPDFAYAHYNLANLLCSSNQMPEAIDSYSRAIALHPALGEAYYNRGLVQLYLRDTEKGCLDISKSGELGVKEAYNVIKRFCGRK